jgi:succinoglycan biosynthesis transport protein ExoP
LAVRYANYNHAHILINTLPILWRRRRVIYIAVVLAAGAAFLFHGTVGERYEPYTLLRVGQGIKDRSAAALGGSFGEGIDLVSRIDSLARIVTTNNVIRQAALQVGFDRLFPHREGGLLSKLGEKAAKFDFSQVLPKQFDELSRRLNFLIARPEVNKTEDTDQEAISELRGLISAKPEGRSDLLRISFRYPDPSVATDFLNELANALVATQADLVQVPGADIFYQQQTKRLEHEAEKAGIDLQNFSVAASIYSVADQRSLLLKRADELGFNIAAARGSIQDRKGQKQAILDQLMILRPVHQSRAVTGIVNSLRGRDYKDSENAVGTVPNFEETPPLLLVRVYQDAMATLLKLNTELNGSLGLEKVLSSELENVNAELASLSSKEAEYDRLKRVLTRASAAADLYGSRALEEQINLDIAKKTQLSSVRVIQPAEQPTTPVFPRIMHLVMLALAAGIAIGTAIALMLEFAREPRREYEQDNVENAVGHLSVRPVPSFNGQFQAAE